MVRGGVGRGRVQGDCFEGGAGIADWAEGCGFYWLMRYAWRGVGRDYVE